MGVIASVQSPASFVKVAYLLACLLACLEDSGKEEEWRFNGSVRVAGMSWSDDGVMGC